MDQHPYQALTPDVILDALEAQGYICDGRLTALNSFENRVFQVGIEDGQPLIAKFYRPDRWSHQQIEEEHRFSLELAQAEWPIVAPMVSPNGHTTHLYDGFTFALFPRFGGHAPELDNLDTLELLGRSMGRLHAISAAADFQTRPAIDISSYAIASREFILNSGYLPDNLRPAYESLTKDLIDLVTAQFAAAPYAAIRLHADCHPGNILWRDERAVFVDFDDCRMGPAVQDLWMLLSGDRQDRTDQLEALLDGYEMFHEFDDTELSLIEPLRTLRMMHYAAWIARRWNDPAFPPAFPWFNTERYWAEHVLELREQFANLQEPPLARPSGNF
jgi:Ser/Thr protein kinase RdoA (MazF antagonist)